MANSSLFIGAVEGPGAAHGPHGSSPTGKPPTAPGLLQNMGTKGTVQPGSGSGIE
jgi:hypothetical protein